LLNQNAKRYELNAALYTGYNEQTYHASLDRPMAYRSSLKQHWGAKV